jgi:hypothetical protein
VLIEIGPVSAESARAWIAYATETLEVLRQLESKELERQALDGFASLLGAWRPIAYRDEPFRWSSQEDPDRAKFLLNALYWAGTIVEREAEVGRARLRPAVADEFHLVLIHEVLDALEHESEADAHFVKELRNVWSVARRD